MVTPTSSFGTQPTSEHLPLLAADALRKIARDEKLKERVENDPLLSGIFKRAAERYIGGSNLPECLHTIRQVNAQGHAASADYMGESTRDEGKAAIETAHFLQLIDAIHAHDLNCTISLDLSHIGLALDPALGIANAAKIAVAARGIGREIMISMEGSERTDAILAAHAELCRQFDHVGITLQARRQRTGADLQSALQRPGKIRLVKGAYDEPESLAWPRVSEGLNTAYRQHAQTLLASRHACSIATHDPLQLEAAHAFIQAQGLATAHIEFETLFGLGAAQSRQMRALGFATRQYIVYGREWFMYVCHRIAEDPQRLFQALVDVVGTDSNTAGEQQEAPHLR